jgi:hypothetical protein
MDAEKFMAETNKKNVRARSAQMVKGFRLRSDINRAWRDDYAGVARS